MLALSAQAGEAIFFGQGLHRNVMRRIFASLF
jgi:hypothetical protein